MMKSLRANFTRKIFTLLAGITFLNMSFILAEITALGLNQKYKSLVQLVTNAGLEEEKEVGGEAGETDAHSKKIDFNVNQYLTHHGILYSIAQRRNKTLANLAIHPGHREIFSPPPERG